MVSRSTHQLTSEKEAQASRTIPNMPPGSALLRANGPVLEHHMRIFGAKLGFAVHYQERGQIIPGPGGAQALYFTNVNAVRGELPLQIINSLPGPPKTLRQGTKHVSSQFSYSWQTTDEGLHNVTYAVFNGAFAILVVTTSDRSIFLSKHADRYPVIAPGDFKKSAVVKPPDVKSEWPPRTCAIALEASQRWARFRSITPL